MAAATKTTTTNGVDSKSNGNPPNPSQTPPPQPLQQQWVSHHHPQWMMQYPPAAAMAMMQQQHMMMYPQHYMPYSSHSPCGGYQHQQFYNNNKQQSPSSQLQQQHQSQSQSGSVEEAAKTIWVGDLLHWMDETYLHTCFSHTGEVLSVKVIRNKQTGQSERYGFVEFYSHATAEKVLQTYNGSPMPNTDQPFRLNWASFNAAEKRSDSGSDLSIFVGDLAPDVTDAVLLDTFSCKYQSVKGAKVVIDSDTGRSKGYGFVRFDDENERSKAMNEMNGVECSARPMRIGAATPKKASGYQQHYSSQALIVSGGHASNGSAAQGSPYDGELDNATIFVGGLDAEVTEEDLRQPFAQFGEVVSVKIPGGKGCGFVQFSNRKDAEDAIERLNGTVIGKQTVRLSWGRNQGNKQWRNHSNQWNGENYGRHGYNGGGYGYSMPPNQDMSSYTAAATVPRTS